VTAVDWIVLAVVVLTALNGWRRGLVASALSLGGFVVGAYVGSRVAAHVLAGGSASRWTPFLGLLGAVAGAAILQAAATFAGAFFRQGLRLTPLRLLDSAGGLLLGAATGLVLVWVVGATALLLPGQTELRRAVQRSAILSRIDERVPPRRLLHVLARIDPLPSVIGPPAPTGPPPVGIARDRDVRRAALAVVRVTGTACGLGVEGSGWFVSRRLVATAAHVVAGERNTEIQLVGEAVPQPVDVVAFDSRNDVAVLRLRGGAGHSRLLMSAQPREGRAVAILGYPENGPLTATPGRIGRTATVITRNADGSRLVSRTITAVAGRVRHGDSGGPAVDADGVVQTMVFAARVGSAVGYGVPPSLIANAVRSAHGPVSTGDCAAG
jgi:uncharacterized membrane protein required for colicin V production